MLLPDTEQPKAYQQWVLPNLKAGTLLMFAHGFNVHYGTIVPPKDVDVALVAPKAPASWCVVSTRKVAACRV